MSARFVKLKTNLVSAYLSCSGLLSWVGRNNFSALKRRLPPLSAVEWRFRDSGAGYKTPDFLTYLLTYLLYLNN